MSRSRLRWRGREVSRRIRELAAQGISDAAEHVLEEANRTVPHDEGTLMRSGIVVLDRQKLMAVVSYDTPYARRQHEDLTLNHPNGRRAKWLELTLQERRQAVYEYIRRSIAEGLR